MPPLMRLTPHCLYSLPKEISQGKFLSRFGPRTTSLSKLNPSPILYYKTGSTSYALLFIYDGFPHPHTIASSHSSPLSFLYSKLLDDDLFPKGLPLFNKSLTPLSEQGFVQGYKTMNSQASPLLICTNQVPIHQMRPFLQGITAS